MSPHWIRRLASVIALTLACLSWQLAAAEKAEKETLTFVSEVWEDATEKDGTGLYFEIMRKVFEPLGYKVNTVTTTYSRSVYLVQTGKMDGFMGSYIDEQEGVLYPYWHFDAEKVSAAYKASVIPVWEGEQSLKGRSVGWVKGYDYDDYISTPMNIKEIKTRRQGLSMVYSDRLDVLLDGKVELEEEFEEGYVDKKHFVVSDVIDLKLYPAFAKNARGEKLRKIYDERFEQLLKSGELHALYEKYEWADFPFESSNMDQ